MTGKILIVDDLATNRIVLKVKLSAAFYRVFQACSGKDALEMAARYDPDLVILGGALPDLSTEQLCAALSQGRGMPPPVIVLLGNEDADARVAALGAGAADVMTHSAGEAELLARVRALLRRRYEEVDLRLQAVAAEPMGLAEEAAQFLRPDRVVLLAETEARARALRARVRPGCPLNLTLLNYRRPQTLQSLTSRPDAIAIRIGPDSIAAGLGTIAELRASSQTRNTPILAVLDEDAAHLAAQVLDIGASDVLCHTRDDRELRLRLSTQLAQKKRGDFLRSRVENGLQAALRDPLTGLYNRRYALNFLQRMIDDARRDRRTCAIIAADLDRFKSVNDTYGHGAGDAVLRQVAANMRAALPVETMVARVGGEEFLIAVPDTSVAGVRRLADRLRRVVRDTPVLLEDDAAPIRVTVSLGVRVISPDSEEDRQPIDRLITQADQALYDSKSGGRDTVTVCLRPAA